jgi:exodeoxyribonuclease V beta subunit
MPEFEQFDLLNSPLGGSNLIEASAGTGKTYTITGLFLRLVLEKNLSVRDILVVTFTEAATGELRDRIRSKLREALIVFSKGRGDDPFMGGLLERHEDPEDASTRLREALYDFDQAAIFTIHGFCRRMLYEKAFESGSLFDTELDPDQGEMERGIIDDFWRRHLYEAPPLFVKYALKRGFTPERLFPLVSGWGSRPDIRIIPKIPLPDDSSPEGVFREALDEVRGAWEPARESVARILMGDEGLNRNRYGKEKIPIWIDAMDACAASGGDDPFLFKGFEKFTASELVRGVKKGHAPPEHPFFESCERLGQAREILEKVYSRRLLRLKQELFTYAREELSRRKGEKNIQSFDDLLTRLEGALKREGGKGLSGAIRGIFRAALIDEFQDTDPVQYAIFKEVFGSGESILFLIGDPKQAIYSFRGADIFAYMEASGDVGSRYTLGENWRSEPDLIAATNTIFSNREAPFVYDTIRFRPSSPAAARDQEFLSIDGDGEASFHLWFMDARKFAEPGKAISKTRAREIIPRAVAAEISRLLLLGRQGRALIGTRPLREGDVAVLARTNAEAVLVQDALSALRISAVLYTTGNLFDSHEALETERVLAALAEPGKDALLRAALATDMMGSSGEGLDALTGDAEAWEASFVRFREYHDLWRERGFIRMFRHLLSREKILPRLMSLPGGERRCTNVLHLSEVLHHRSVEGKPNMPGLLKWLSEQREGGTPGREEHPLRLERDENAVKLVTIHRSKGLEYPVVFCPFLWEGSRVRGQGDPFVFHDQGDRMRLTLDLGSEEADKNRGLAEKERLAENLRLFYVALTRAKCRCYMVWGRFNEGDTSAPAYLFHPSGSGEGRDIVRETGDGFKTLDDEELLRGLEMIEAGAGKSLKVSQFPEGRGREVGPPAERSPELTFRTFGGRIERQWRITSFSSLVSGHLRGPETADRDRIDPGWDVREPVVEEEPAGVFAFPRGTRAGTLFHDILEHLDFQEKDPSSIDRLVAEKLRAYGFQPSWEETVRRMLDRVLSVPLDPEGGNSRLSGIPGRDRLNELEFYFPLKGVSPERLRRIIGENGGPDLPAEIPESLERLDFSPVKGFMKGFIDLVFGYRGRFYLVDWKSNYLGSMVEDYGRKGLAAAMEEGLYTLQYLIYATALNLYLKLRIPNYRYDTHFGCVYYIFLRGVDPDRGPEYGIYRTRPSEKLIRALCDHLIDRA